MTVELLKLNDVARLLFIDKLASPWPDKGMRPADLQALAIDRQTLSGDPQTSGR